MAREDFQRAQRAQADLDAAHLKLSTVATDLERVRRALTEKESEREEAFMIELGDVEHVRQALELSLEEVWHPFRSDLTCNTIGRGSLGSNDTAGAVGAQRDDPQAARTIKFIEPNAQRHFSRVFGCRGGNLAGQGPSRARHD